MLEFATSMGPVPYSWSPKAITVSGSRIRVEIEFRDAALAPRVVPDPQTGAPVLSFVVDLPVDPAINLITLVAQQAEAAVRSAWVVESGGDIAVLCARLVGVWRVV